MKKFIVFLFIVVIILLASRETTYVVPNESIRLRLIASSNEISDQIIKLNVKEEITDIIREIESESNNIYESRENIKKNIPKIEKKLTNLGFDYDINYGENMFPLKTYKGVTYSEGNYESLVITLGEGLGENWWCVIFPPLCLVETNSEDLDDSEYSLYINNIIDKFN